MCPEHVTFPKANGEWWRAKLERNYARDRRNDEALAAAGWAVVRIWEHEEVEVATERIVRAVTDRSPEVDAKT
jgi:DNA mismatch endonuclease, patch repair protein